MSSEEAQKNSEISLSHNVSLTEENISSLINSFKEDRFFRTLMELDPELLNDHKMQDNFEIILMNNIIDEDDEEKKLITYTKEVNESNIVFNNCFDEIEDEEEYERIHFDIFTIKFSVDCLEFNMIYNAKRHPKYVTTIIKKIFDRIFSVIESNLEKF